MLRSIFSILFLLITVSSISQTLVIGTVVDSAHHGISNASVIITGNNAGQLPPAFITDSSGRFALRLPQGKYSINITAIGFHPGILRFNVEGIKDKYLPDIILRQQINVLQNLTVTTQTKQIETRQGKLIYNIDKSLTAQGTSAFDQIRKIPGITVDAEENLSLKGSSLLTVMIDGKISYLGPQQLTTYLKSLPAENLQRIEVMSVPSSEFDAAGNAGVINIVTRKMNRQGYALNLRAGAGIGKYPQSTNGFTGNLGTKAFNFFGSYNYNYNHSNLVRNSYRTIRNNGKIVSYDRHSVDPAIANNNSFKAGADVRLSKSSTIGFVYDGTHNRWTRDAGGPTYLRNLSGQIDSVALNKNYTDEPAHSNAYNLNFSLNPDTTGTVFTMDADKAVFYNNSIGYLDNQVSSTAGNPLQPYQSLHFIQPSKISIKSIKADFVRSSRQVLWKTGLKYSSVTTNNNFRYDSLLNGIYQYSSLLSNHFVYDERIAAAYASFNSKPDKNSSLDAGLRLEHTFSRGRLLNASVENIRRYLNWFPYLSFTRSTDQSNSINISVSRRINRPQYANLNPTRYFFDKYSYHEGNPFLQPELSWNGAFTYSLKETYIATFTFSRIQNAILDFASQDSASGILRVSDRNYSHKTSADLLLVAPFKPLKFWSVQATADVIYINYTYQDDKILYHPEKVNVDLQLAQNFSFKKGYAAELNTYYTSPSLNGTYTLRRYFQMDAALRKSFLKNKLDATLSLKDIFKTDRFWAYSIYKATDVRYNHKPDTRRVNLALVYRIGGKLNTGKERKLEEEGRL